jgi:hypothetical protein
MLQISHAQTKSGSLGFFGLNIWSLGGLAQKGRVTNVGASSPWSLLLTTLVINPGPKWP